MIKIIDLHILKKAYDEYTTNKITYEKMYNYYKGDIDIINNYQKVTERPDNRIDTNFIKELIKEEVSYSLGNNVTYISKSRDENIVNDIDYYLDHWSEGHDSNLAKNMLIYSLAYELYYVDREGQFSSKIMSPREGYAYVDDFGNISFFMHSYKLKFDDRTYIDVYDDNFIYHFNDRFEEFSKPTKHIFSAVPVGICQLSKEGIDDAFIQNTLDTIEDKIYQLSSRINYNEKMQSSLSSLVLRARLIALEGKYKLNQKAIWDCIKTRLKFLFEYLEVIKNIQYDFRDIKVKFNPNIPQDD